MKKKSVSKFVIAEYPDAKAQLDGNQYCIVGTINTRLIVMGVGKSKGAAWRSAYKNYVN